MSIISRRHSWSRSSLNNSNSDLARPSEFRNRSRRIRPLTPPGDGTFFGRFTRRNRIAPIDVSDVFVQDPVTFASASVKDGSEKSEKNIPVAENLNAVEETDMASPLNMRVAEVVKVDNSCCLPGIFSSNCRICPQEAPEVPIRMGKFAGRRLRKRHSAKKRGTKKLKKRHHTRRQKSRKN